MPYIRRPALLPRFVSSRAEWNDNRLRRLQNRSRVSRNLAVTVHKTTTVLLQLPLLKRSAPDDQVVGTSGSFERRSSSLLERIQCDFRLDVGPNRERVSLTVDRWPELPTL